MNILIPDSWLREHLETKAKPEQLKELLSLCGPSVERINEVDGEVVYDIELTTNRVDAASIRGIAREAAAILPEFDIPAKLSPFKVPTPRAPQKPTAKLKITNDPKLCNRITCVILEVTIGPSPEYIKKRLEASGIRSLNNLVDITNYVMLELGHPTHVFDFDRLATNHIRVRESKPGEKIVTLDSKSYTLPGGDIVIVDHNNRIVDLPGIMGTYNSVVTDHTKRVLFFIDNNHPTKMRRTSMSLGIRTQAVTLNEKHVDPELAQPALYRGIQLFQEIANAKIASQIYDIYPNKPKLVTTKLTQKQIGDYLGIEISPTRVKQILTNLGCDVKLTTDNLQLTTYSITSPTSRLHDLQIPQDYIEEIARIYGYHRLPSTLMPTSIPDHPSPENFHLEHQIKTWLADWGFTEVYTNSMVSQKLAKQSGIPLTKHLQITNPLSEEWVYLRRTLTPSHLEVITQHSGFPEIDIFEIANTYHPQPGDLPQEQLQLVITTTQPFSSLRGIVDALMDKFYISNLTIKPSTKPSPPFMVHQTGDLYIGETLVGIIGRVFHTRQVYSVQIDLSSLFKLARTYPAYQPLSPYPAIVEDLSFSFPSQTAVGPIISAIQAISPLIADVALIDTYQTSYTFRISYQSQKGNLSSTEVSPIREKIILCLQNDHRAMLKGQH